MSQTIGVGRRAKLQLVKAKSLVGWDSIIIEPLGHILQSSPRVAGLQSFLSLRLTPSHSGDP